ncbi:MAG TPA: ATP-binding protein [Candidatus Sulfotelmatobacter sp.]|jgi:two-component system OmpR family sensor kinase|nr:ATP-binding protein [Candidatus Sulfotelmatobacter sp.]
MLESVRSRITLWYSGLLGLFLILLAVLTYFLYWHNIRISTDSNLLELSETYVTTFNAEIKDAEGADPRKEAARVAMIEHRFRDVVFAIVDGHGQVILSSLDLPAIRGSHELITPAIFSSKEFLALAHAPATTGIGAFQNVPGGKNGFRGYSRLLEPEDQTVSLVILQSLHPQKEIMEDIRHTFYWVIPIALLLASAGGYFLARKSLAPVTDMAAQARGMGAARLSERLEVSNPRDELGTLALSFNELLDRLEKSFEQQRRFVADASHELRTPVAILQGETEVTLSRPDRSPEEYRETLAILRDESHRLARIIEDLFTLTRADAGQYPLNLRDLYLDELAADVLHRTRSLALAKGVSLTSSIQPELPLNADEDLLRRMLLNLLDNAIKYAPAGGMINVDCRLDGNSYVLRVSNTGPGIPAELQSRIFERFFRADKARSRSEGDTGGAGLGLSIARWIAEAHHGRLELTQSDTSGTTFTAYLPAPVRSAITG